jgi:hypothetical protein
VEGPRVQIEKRRGLWAKLPFFFLSIQNRNRGGAHRGDLPAVDGGRPRHGGVREWGGQREEVEGDSFLSSPRAGVACRGRSTAAGFLQPRWHGRWWLEAREGERKAGAAWG